MLSESQKQNLSTVREYILEWKALLDGIGIWVIEPRARLFDSIAFSLLNKAYRLSHACIELLQANFPDEAYGVSRSIIDCSLNLRYLTLDRAKIDERSWNYLNFIFCEKKHFLEQCRKYFAPGPELDQVELYARQEKIEEQWASIVSSRMVTKNIPHSDWRLIEGSEWNGWKIVTENHPLDAKIGNSVVLHKQFAADFRGASAMVHCSIRALDNNFADPMIRFKVGENLATTFDHNFEPLVVIVTNLHQLVRYVFFGTNIDLAQAFDDLLDKTSAQLVHKERS